MCVKEYRLEGTMCHYVRLLPFYGNASNILKRRRKKKVPKDDGIKAEDKKELLQ